MTNPPNASGWKEVTGLVLGLTALITVLLVAFAWPPSEMEPRNLPVAVAGPPGAAEQVAAHLGTGLGEDALDVTAVDSREAAVAAIRAREVYGAIVMSGQGPETLVASAGSPVVAQLLTQVGTQLSTATGTPPTVTDVVPLPVADPRGAVFAAGAFPLVIGGIAVGVTLALQVATRWLELIGALAAAVGAGLALAAVQQFWFDALGGSYWANAAVYAAAIGAMALVVVGLHQVLGRLGIGLAAATILLLGNPLSAIATAPELLPDGWSTLGQLLPPGAAGTALRSTAFFDGAGATAPMLVLAGWLLVGVALLALPSRRAAAQPSARRTADSAGLVGPSHA